MQTKKAYQLRIRYSQNGREILDTLFRTVGFFWTKQDEADARAKAQAIADEYGCGMAEVYHVQDNCVTYLSSHYGRKAEPAVSRG